MIIPFLILIALIIAVIIGIGKLFSVRKKDRKNYIIQKATPIQLALVNERDDVWLKGITECDSPLTAPHFDFTCLFYKYELQKLVTTIVPARDFPFFKTKEEWKSREKLSEDTSLFLRDGEHIIDIDGNAGELIDHKHTKVTIGRTRHKLWYVPHPMELNAVGSISEGKHRLEEHANIPLLVTTSDRKKYVLAAEHREGITRFFGFFLSWIGLTGLLGIFFGVFEIPHGGLWAIVLPTAILTLYWSILKYNILIDYQNRVGNAWNQIDVDLTMRYELIPKLVACVEVAMDHERKLLDALIDLREEAFANREGKLRLEGKIAETVSTIIARIERYPQLTAQRVTAKLIRELRAIEVKIAHGRVTYNNAVGEYNDNVMMFPQRLIAEKFGFKEYHFFASPAEDVAVRDAT